MAGDPFYNKVALLLPMTGSNGSTTFTDVSSSPKTVTANGNAQISTALEAGGNGYFDGTGDYISTPDHNDFNFGSDNFTIEAFVYFSVVPDSGQYAAIFSQRSSATSNNSFNFWYGGTEKWYVSYSTNGVTQININNISTHTPTSGLFYHVAAVRNSSNMDIFIDGVKQTTRAISGSLYNSSANIRIGAANDVLSYFLNGYMKDFRVTKGTARYTENFTPPSTPLPTYLEPRPLELFAVNQPIVQAFNPTIFNG